MREPLLNRSYISIGGVGGSGTRLVASLLISSGLQIGRDINASNDTLSFTLFFKDRAILTASEDEFDRRLTIFLKHLNAVQLSAHDLEFAGSLSIKDRVQHPADWLAERVRRLKCPPSIPVSNAFLGWKEPNTHVIVERLLGVLPSMKYIHVVRHGIDMAYSSNQNQVQFWDIAIPAGTLITPEQSLGWWCKVQKRILSLRDRYPERILILRFEDLLRSPEDIVKQLLEFCEADPRLMNLGDITSRVQSERVTARGYGELRLDVKIEQIEILRAFGY